jgi:hypothetical protein
MDVEHNPIKTIGGKVVLVILVAFSASIVAITVVERKPPFYLFLLAGVIIARGIADLRKRTLSIYENGIHVGIRFVEWNEIRGYEWRNGVLILNLYRYPGTLIIDDADGRVKRIVEERVGK